ncbi:MAG: hypothetical protein A3F47_02315 [Candidatus Staskawiczbacteria bacterium RIFCSPHIGHO2_12_FULL_38_11]|uniref:Uncharacterized protein n=1 Tax=Candidatus Staskawiczbacteria bacterium RIFCSPHIGHO2_12_FULL_38_11 TaxID=1802209 RepID=A0A1G2I569_9BACT|nr:MAG: hypothetical protein A3F47_02315 [Candidatus Staskawiczbacteria bacterium RIFCSPHIGHO2_12_FULL_38_11]
MAIEQIFIYDLPALVCGYLLGRFGHCYLNVWIGNPSWLPHHWIYGVILMVISFFVSPVLGLITFYFGIGHFISDLKDFWELKFFAPDEEGEKRFFHID